MNLIAALEKKHSARIKSQIVRYVGDNPKRFKELFDLLVSDNPRHVQWSGWALSDIVQRHPHLITPYLRGLLKKVNSKAHVSIKRNTMRIIQFIDIPKTLTGLVFDKAFSLFTDTSESIATRVFSMTALRKVAMMVPDLKNEVIIVIEEQIPYGSPAFRSRAKADLKNLRK